jgi:hypothetical protein
MIPKISHKSLIHLRCSTVGMNWIPEDTAEAFPDSSLDFKKRSPVTSTTF